ncbi:MAG: hypothetical protein IIZ53_02255, partial [Ruminococcus sp.]|nr:hypothetical protein [Ruminococcus sp.]
MLSLIACGNAENSSPAPAETAAQTESAQQETLTKQTEAEVQIDNHDDKSVPANTISTETKDNAQNSGKDTIVV